MKGDSLHCCYREQVAYALYARFMQPKLYKYAQSGDWDLIPARCRSHPKEASFVNKYAPNDTPLHRLLRYDCTQSIIDDENTLKAMEEWKWNAVVALLQSNPQAATRTDAFGRTTLHLACADASLTTSKSLNDFHSTRNKNHHSHDEQEKNIAAEIALHIAQANPRAASVQDTVDQRTPLHYLVARNDYISIPLLRLLISSSQSALQVKDVTGETPADIVRRRQEEISNAAQVLEILQSVAAAAAAAAEGHSTFQTRVKDMREESSRSTARTVAALSR